MTDAVIVLPVPDAPENKIMSPALRPVRNASPQRP